MKNDKLFIGKQLFITLSVKNQVFMQKITHKC